MKKILFMTLLALLSVSCSDLFEPAIENIRDVEEMIDDPAFAHGVLLSAYTRLPYSGNSYSDVATDDAVSNDNNNSWRKMATGSWSSRNNPTARWASSFHSIQYINLFLEYVDKTRWTEDENAHIMFADRLKGEALALRALQYYYLLMVHGGKGESGEMLGVTILDGYQDSESTFSVPRNTFKQCVDYIYADLEQAIELLADDYKIHTDDEVPQKYVALGIDAGAYDRVFGSTTSGRISGRIARAMMAQVALFAASPAYNGGKYDLTHCERAAKYAASLIEDNGGVAGLYPNGCEWYQNVGNHIDNKNSALYSKEILWRGNFNEGNGAEANNFPPTLFGKGRINPTQNLVDAFPMMNGYPISDKANSGYDAANPYAGRDPRLAKFIVLNGSKMGVNNTVVNTAEDGPDNNALNKYSQLSTRTGYYLRKTLRNDCNPNPASSLSKTHFEARIRLTEIYLIYAEAANELAGGKAAAATFTAYDVVKQIRSRAGIDDADPYLNANNNAAALRDIIRNERRLELCFENFRFWDLRRWQMDMTEAAKAVRITGSTPSYEVFDEENRVYDNSYMLYGPIPYNEALKFGYEQNAGW